MPLPFFTIVIPTFNSESTLQNALDSILNQQYTNFEILIIDGLSGDGTIDVINQNSRVDPRIISVSEKDQGIYDAMNKGLSLASGEWIYFLGSDDRLHNESVLQIVFNNLQGETADLLYGNVLLENKQRPYDGKFNAEKLLERNISHQAIFYSSRIFIKLGGFNTRYKIQADWEFNLRCFSAADFKSFYLDLVIADFAPGGLSAQQDRLVLGEIIVPRKLHLMNSLDPRQYLHKVRNYDSFWRLLRNAKIRGKADLISSSRGQSIPGAVIHMLNHQSKISAGLLKTGFISKICMFMSYLTNRLNRSL